MIEKEFEEGTFMSAWAQLEEDKISFVVPASKYNIKNDERLLIPFIKNHKIGFVNKKCEIVVNPSFDVINGEVCNESDFIRVGVQYSYAYERKNAAPEIYTRIKWGLLNAKGECVLNPDYSSIRIESRSFVICQAYGYNYKGSKSMLNQHGETLIPFGVYSDIDPFEEGLARCRKYVNDGAKRKEWCGLINEDGEVILECKDRQIMPFYGRYHIRYFDSMVEMLKKENPAAYARHFKKSISAYEYIQSVEEMERKKDQENMNIIEQANALSRLEVLQLSKELYIDSLANNKIQKEIKYDTVKVIELKDGSYGVMKNGEFVVPFGLYAWIDRFDNGLARVRTKGRTTYTKNTLAIFDFDSDTVIEGQDNIKKAVENDLKEHPEQFAKWGIIDEDGKEVLPVIYDEVWNFFGKGRKSTKAEKNGITKEVYFSQLKSNSRRADSKDEDLDEEYDDNYESDYGTHYGEYAGTYAQDVAGYSDDVINDAFDGDPDAYWNID